MYKITNRGILEIIDKIMGFKKKDAVKIISYDAFVLALIIGSKPASTIMFKGTTEIVKKISSPFLIENSPIIAAMLTTAGLAFRMDLNGRLVDLGINIILILAKSAGVFSSTEFLRSNYFINCAEYVRELPQKDLKELPYVETFPEGDSSGSKISYTRESLSRHDGFVSTSSNQQLHYQEDVENLSIETLDGKMKQTQKLSGEKNFEWLRNRATKKSVKSNYIPLDHRTRTLADVRELDSTIDRESVNAITKSVQEEQIKARLIREAAEGE